MLRPISSAGKGSSWNGESGVKLLAGYEGAVEHRQIIQRGARHAARISNCSLIEGFGL